VPERERQRQRSLRKIGPLVDPEHARRMTERRELRDEGSFHVLARDEQLDRLDSGFASGVDEILALADEKPLLLPLPPRLQKAPDELQLRVVRGRDHSA
jgi:hypothetical protein